MALPPLARRRTVLYERLRLLDDSFIPTLTPTNTWLENVWQTEEAEEDDIDVDKLIEEDRGVSLRMNRFEKPCNSARSTSHSERSTLLTRMSSEPRSSSLPPAKQTTDQSPSPPCSIQYQPTRARLAHSQAQRVRDADNALRRTASDAESPSIGSSPTLAILQGQDTAPLNQLSQMYGGRGESDDWTSPSRTYSTEDGPFSVSPWAQEDRRLSNDFLCLQDLCNVSQGTSNEASSSSGSARPSEVPKSVNSRPANSDIRDADDGDDNFELPTLDMDDVVDTNDHMYGEEVDVELTSRSPSFQIRVFDPESTDYDISNKYSGETTESVAEEWSGKVQELSSITEEGSAAAEATDLTAMDLKRRSSDTIVQFPLASSGHGIRRVSTMSDYQRLKGRHTPPKLVAFKASPAGPAVTAMSVQPPDAWTVRSMYEGPMGFRSAGVPVRRISQTFHSDLGISQMIWEQPSSSCDSEITVLTGSGVDYLVADEIEEEDAMPSPMERLKTKLKAWSWERELSECSPDNRARVIPLMETEERRHWRQSSDCLENPPGPPNTVRHSGQSSTINSDPQTPVDVESLEYDEDDCVIELKTKSFPRPIPFQPASGSITSGADYLAIPRRTNSLPSPRTMLERDEERFPHRDSVDILHARMDWDEIKDKRSQELIVNSRDSFLLTKSRLEAKHPKAVISATPPGGAITWSRFGSLSPIADASPPGISLLEAKKGKRKADRAANKKVKVVEKPEHHELEMRVGKHKAGGSGSKEVEVGQSSELQPHEHKECPICEVNRPRWFEAEQREW